MAPSSFPALSSRQFNGASRRLDAAEGLGLSMASDAGSIMLSGWRHPRTSETIAAEPGEWRT